MLRAFLAALLLWAFGAPAANFTDLWWNKDESGWGMTLSHHNDTVFGVWYVYDSAGNPTWVVMSDGRFSADGRTVTGLLYQTTGPSYRQPFQSSQVRVQPVGNARVDFAPNEVEATVTVTMGGTTATKRVTRQSFGSVPASYPDDLSDLWWDPKESGWGLTLAHHGDTVFGVWYTYGEDGKPLWVVMSDGRFSGADTISGKLYTTAGGAPLSGAFDAKRIQVEEVGAATITMGASEGRMDCVVRGMRNVKRLIRQSFGKATDPLNRKPSVSLQVVPGASPLVAPASVTLKANASDADGKVAKVAFYLGPDKVGESAAAPYQVTLEALPMGKYFFSAAAVDDKGAFRIATSSAVFVNGPGGTPPPEANRSPGVAITAPAAGALYAAGATVDIAANASDADGTVARVEFFVDTTKVGEATASPWRASWTSSAGSHSVTAVATDDKGATTTSAMVAITVAGPAPVLDASTRDAARFLTQATFGIKSISEIDALKAQGYAGWLDQQFLAQAASHVGYVNQRKLLGDKPTEERAYEAIWQQWLTEPGQLRARMSFALSEIFVISNVAPDLDTYAMASYMDMLNRNAFGNFRQLLEDVTLHPAMGYYLNMIGSRKADAAKGTHPNENYAREVMQLFTIGLYKLNPDGSRMLDAQGKPVPTYDQAVVAGMAAAFTGWNFAGNDTSDAAIFNPARENWLDPMVPWEMHHDTAAKAIFDGITLPAGQGARKDLKDALDALFNHPNVGPFIGRELIQRFVTSNPSPAYIQRVAAAFDNNGAGVRGDLKAVVRAVLMDPEARDVAATDAPTWGKQREPVIRFANFLRAFNAASTSGRNRIWYLDSADEGLNQSPLLSPSVFNFFSPNYRQPGPLAAANLVAPEFQITTETSMVGTLNFFATLVKNGSYGSGDTKLVLNYAELNALANDPPALADRIALLLMNGRMSDELRGNLITMVNAMPVAKTGGSGSVTDRVKAALILVAMSPDYVIQR